MHEAKILLLLTVALVSRSSLAADLLRDSCGNVKLGDSLRHLEIRANVTSQGRIIPDHQGDLYFINKAKPYILKSGRETPIKIKATVMDIGTDPRTQEILFSHGAKLSTFTNGTFHEIKNIRMQSFTMREDGAVYFSDAEKNVFLVDAESQELQNVPGLSKGSHLELVKNGDVYFVDEDDYASVLKKEAFFPNRISGIPQSSTTLIVEDKTTNIVYVCTKKGLFIIKDQNLINAELLLESIPITSLGFNEKGDIYMGINKELILLTAPKDELCYMPANKDQSIVPELQHETTTILEDLSTVETVVPVIYTTLTNAITTISSSTELSSESTPVSSSTATTASVPITTITITILPETTTQENQIVAASFNIFWIPLIVEAVIILALIIVIIYICRKMRKNLESNKKKAEEIEMMKFTL